MYFVYFLRLSNDTIYTGYTADLRKRIRYHSHGLVSHTAKSLPVHLISYIAVQNKDVALKLERHFKKGSGIAFRNKHLIINF